MELIPNVRLSLVVLFFGGVVGAVEDFKRPFCAHRYSGAGTNDLPMPLNGTFGMT